MVDTSNRKRFYLIDGHAQMFRAYHAIRSLSSPVTGEPTNATFGFVSMLLKLLREEKPDYLAMAIDIGGDQGTFRTQLDPQYKAQRPAPPEDFGPQVQRIVEIVGMLNVPVLSAATFEADDVIATVCDRVSKLRGPGAGVEVRIVSRDKDLKQLLGEQVTMFDPFKNELIDPRKLKEEEGVEPGQVVDVLALMGDNVDNIPGAPGIGPKTACKLIGQYGSLDNLLSHLDELSAKQRENVEKAKDRYALNRQLVMLRRDVPVDFELEQARVRLPAVASVEPLFRQLGFTRHLRELEELSPPPEWKAKKQAIRKSGGDFSESLFGGMEEEGKESESAEPQFPGAAGAGGDLERAKDSDYLAIVTGEQLEELAGFLRTLDWVSVDTETTDVNPMRAKLCGVSLAWPSDVADAKPQAAVLRGKRGVYVPVRAPAGETHLSEEQVVAAMRPILEDEKIAKIGQNIKYDMLILRGAGITLRGVMSDTMVASYLIDASRSSHSLDNLAMAFAGHRMIAISELIGTGKKQATFDTVPLAKATTYAAEDADVTLRLHELFMPKLKVMGLVDLFRGLEMPLVHVLAELEYNGIAVDAAELDRQRVGLEHRIGELRGEILELAQRDFNPDSPRQLADVLFNELGCKSYRKTKTGPSTDSEVLQRIVDEQAGDGAAPGVAVAERVLEYRQLTKLVGTYLGSLKDAIDTDGRIHASFNQTVAATGRLSSSDPNLQNIPIRTDLGRQIRKAFVAPPGSVLLSADYSQIELRLLAHLSQDPALIEAFENDRDIHRAVAAEVFGIALDEVTSEQRSAAKMVNFGIVYGITPYGLARRLSPGAGSEEIERAKQIITDYKNRYPRINQFLARCVEEAETKGYVETIMKRRRPIPQITSRQYNVKSLGERMAINTVVQGSAADLIKLAMVKLHRRIKDESLPMKMLLQIHDELVFETPADKAEQMTTIVRSEMTGAMKLSVPLKVDVHWAGNWFEAK